MYGLEDEIIYNGFEDAILGVAERINMTPVITYDTMKIIEILMDKYKMTQEEAYEFFAFNILNAWIGESTPVFVTTKEYLIEED